MRSSPPWCFSAGATVGTSSDLLPPAPPSHLFPEIDQPRPPPPPPQPLHPPVPLSYYFPEIEYQRPTSPSTIYSDGEEEVNPSSSSAASETLDSHGEDSQRLTVDVLHGEGSSSYCMRLVKIYCKGNPLLHVTIRKDRLVLAPANLVDPFQWWLKDEKHAKIKDEEGFPCFALVSKATGQAIGCLTPGHEEPLQLIEYNPDAVDAYVLWTEDRDLGSGYRTVRPVSNIQLGMNAYEGATMGTHVQLYPVRRTDNDNALWRITTIKKFLSRN